MSASGIARPWHATDPSRAAVARSAAVTAVVCAAFDGPTDDAVLAVRSRVRALGVTLPVLPPHRPHLTLTAARMHPAQLDRLDAVVRELAERRVLLALRLAEVGRFGRAGALWLGPGGSGPEPVRALQREVDEALAATGWERAFSARSSPAQWVAHCSLATRLHPARLREVQARIAEEYQPIPAVVAGLAVILVGGSGDVAVHGFGGGTGFDGGTGLDGGTGFDGGTGRISR